MTPLLLVCYIDQLFKDGCSMLVLDITSRYMMKSLFRSGYFYQSDEIVRDVTRGKAIKYRVFFN